MQLLIKELELIKKLKELMINYHRSKSGRVILLY